MKFTGCQSQALSALFRSCPNRSEGSHVLFRCCFCVRSSYMDAEFRVISSASGETPLSLGSLSLQESPRLEGNLSRYYRATFPWAA